MVTRTVIYGYNSVCPVSNENQKRIWNELYKVLDSSDVVLHVLDARDPLGTRCRSVEKYLREEAPHKHLIFVINKVDLVPTKVCVSSSISSPLPPLCPSYPNALKSGCLPQYICCITWKKSVTSLGDQISDSTSCFRAGSRHGFVLKPCHERCFRPYELSLHPSNWAFRGSLLESAYTFPLFPVILDI